MLEIENKIEKRVEKIKLYDDILKIDNLGDRLKYLRKKYKALSMAQFSKSLEITKESR